MAALLLRAAENQIWYFEWSVFGICVFKGVHIWMRCENLHVG